MKYRLGHVANSSSSSFIAIGWSFSNTRELVMSFLDHAINSKELSSKFGIDKFNERNDDPEYEYYESIDDYFIDKIEDEGIVSLFEDYPEIELLYGPDESRYIGVELKIQSDPSHFVNEVIRKKELIDVAIENNEILKFLANSEPPYVIHECWTDY